MLGITLLAEQDLSDSGFVLLGLTIAAACLLLVLMIAVLAKRYKRCPPNRVLVIYGKTGTDGPMKCVHGGAAFVWPLIQDYAWMSLEPIRVEVSRQKTSSGRTIGDPLPRVFSVAVGTSSELIETAVFRVLGLTANEIRQHAEDIIVARLDRLLDAVEAGDVQPGTEDFYRLLEGSLEPELNQLGLTLINFRRE